MSRRFYVIPKIILILAVLIFYDANLVFARFIARDATAVDPVKVCTDGIYLGVGKNAPDDPSTVEVTVSPELQPGGEVVFETGDEVFTVPLNPVPGPPALTHSAYFTRLWKDSFTPLTVGSEIILAGGNTNPTVTVQDCLVVPQETPVGSAITYQGSLVDGENPANGNYDFQFQLYDASTGGDQIGTTVIKDNLTVSDGIFSTELDFGSGVFSGGARWLEVGVRPGSSAGVYTVLSPRQSLTAAPYALSVLNVPDHNHLDQTWIGNYTPLEIKGSFELAPLVLDNNSGDGLIIEHASGSGISISSGDSGVHVGSAGNPSQSFSSGDKDGFSVDGAEGIGLWVGWADSDGINVAGDALAGFFSGGIQVTGGCVGCTVATLGINGSSDTLEPGEIVSVQGVQPSNFDGVPVLMDVAVATSGQPVIGVVQGRAETISVDESRDGESGQRLVPRGGAAQPGDYVTIVIYGPVQVKANPAGGQIIAGSRLAVDEGGLARSLQTTEVNGLQIDESAPTIGIALQEASSDGLIWVLVNPR